MTLEEFEKQQKRKRWMLILRNPLLWWYRDRIIKECYDYLSSVAANNYHLAPEKMKQCERENDFLSSSIDDMVYDMATDRFLAKWLKMKGWSRYVRDFRREALELRAFGPQVAYFSVKGMNSMPLAVRRADEGISISADKANVYARWEQDGSLTVYAEPEDAS